MLFRHFSPLPVKGRGAGGLGLVYRIDNRTRRATMITSSSPTTAPIRPTTFVLSPKPVVGRAVGLLVTVGPGTEVPGVPVVVTWMKAGLGVRLGTLVGVPGLLVGVLVGGVPLVGVVVVSPPEGCWVAARLVWSAGLKALVVAAAFVCSERRSGAGARGPGRGMAYKTEHARHFSDVTR